MTTGQVISKLIKKRFGNQKRAADAAGIPSTYVSRIISMKIKSGVAYDALLDVLDVPHEIIVFKTFCTTKIKDKARRAIVEQVMPEIAAKIDLMFNSKVD